MCSVCFLGITRVLVFVHWKARVAGCLLHPMNCPLLRETPDNLMSVADAVNLVTILDTSKICVMISSRGLQNCTKGSSRTGQVIKILIL